ncbi:MAG: helix-turn-helix domain-containing protein [Halolamina sp.]
MVGDPLADDDPDLQQVLDALDDPDCRAIVRQLEEPMTAGEVSEVCDIPTSTTYRKLELLSEASLLAEGTEVRSDGHHATLYRVDFEEVAVRRTEDRSLDVAIERPARDPDEQLASMWQEVRKQT